MAKKKITIADAMDLLHSVAKEEGVKLNISVEHVETVQHEAPTVLKSITLRGFKRIPLRAGHSICGHSYGPGIVDVPMHLVNHLLYQDQQAAMNEEAFRSREEKCYIAMQRTHGGQQAYVGVRVSSDIFQHGFDISRLGSDYMISM